MKIRTVVIAVAAAACIGFLTKSTQAQGPLTNNLFSQYTTQGSSNLTNAGMYPAPHWVPRKVGHTYNTYQPLMPHEMMYTHSRNYYNFYGEGEQFYSPKYGHHGGSFGPGALNKTSVVWQSGCHHMGPLPGTMFPFAGLHYKVAAHKYGLRPAKAGHGLHGHHRAKRASADCECATGDCDSGYGGEVYGGEVYGGEVYGGEIYSAPASGCASGGCAAELPGRNMNR